MSTLWNKAGDESGVVGRGEGRSRERLVERSQEEVAKDRMLWGLP